MQEAPPHTPPDPAYPRRWLAAAVMIVASTVDLIDGTIVNVALPTIRRDLAATGAQLEWVVSAYMLAFAAALITAGSLGDLLGRKRLFLIGTAVFGAASLGAGVAQTANELIAARVVQGAAAATMSPQVLATFRAMFAGKERGTAFGVYGATLGFASAIGLILGGVLTQPNLFGWRWRTVFLVNVPIVVGSLIAAAIVVPEPRARSHRRPDPAGLGVGDARSGRRDARRPRRRGGAAAAAPGRAAAAPAASAPARLHGRADRPAGVLDRHTGVRARVRPVAADRPGVLAAPGRPHDGRVQRRQLHRGSLRDPARAAVGAARAHGGRAPDGGGHGGHRRRRPPRRHRHRPLAARARPARRGARPGPARHPARERRP